MGTIESMDELVERYVLGLLDVETARRVEAAAVHDVQVRDMLKELQEAMAHHASDNATQPPTGLRSHVIQAIQLEVEKERASGRPPLLHHKSTVADFASWIGTDHVRPEGAGNMQYIPLDESDDRQTALVWLEQEEPTEIHTDCVERFLILEGTCDVTIGNELHAMIPGNVITIPMFTEHSVRVTSTMPCKAILQRVMVV
ncbi:MAG: cupin domain-containing protein [Flavobacteriales bacterium]|nr:cupin domain-containing protein [Flavobacteriales bacterium]HQW41052.1 cupin domain-containing protein [Flavobacteriales bacterium]